MESLTSLGEAKAPWLPHLLAKPEHIMLLVLPIIPSRNSHNFYPLFLFSHAITYIIIPVTFFKFLCQ